MSCAETVERSGRGLWQPLIRMVAGLILSVLVFGAFFGGASTVLFGASAAGFEAVRMVPFTVTFRSLLEAMIDGDALARFPDPVYECLQASSYNRASTRRTQPEQDVNGWFADSDGLGYLRTEEVNGSTEWVLLEHRGPGCLTKIWTPDFYYGFADRRGPNIRVYLDDNPVPVLDESLIGLVTGKGSVARPFAEATTRAGNIYLPIPFGRSCRVTLTAKPFYYLINYRAYAEGALVKTFAVEELEKAKAVMDRVGRALLSPPAGAWSGWETSGRVSSGKAMELVLPNGPAAVREFRVTLPEAVARPEILRSTVLVMTCDGEEMIWCPEGDFFCSTDWLHPLETRHRRVTADGVMEGRWVMPYRGDATLRLLNLGSEAVEVAVQAQVGDWEWDDRSMYFRANWRPDDMVPGTPFQDWNFIDVRGQGVLVGDAWTVLNIQGSWWGEGDEKIYVDDAWEAGFPTHFGTGTEDYYGWAGGEVPTRKDEFSTPFLANARVGGLDGGTTGFNICSRARGLDAVPFRRRLVFDMESSFGTDIRNPWNLLGYSAVTMWYARPGATHNRGACADEAARPLMSIEVLKARADALQHLLEAGAGEKAVVFTESREHPIRRGRWPSTEALMRQREGEASFLGRARPGEFLVFQVGVYALEDTGPLGMTFGDLVGAEGIIPGETLTCLSLEGTDYRGRGFKKELSVGKGDVQPLWVGVSVPDDVRGRFVGTLQVDLGTDVFLPVRVALEVGGEPVAEHGDAVAENLSRLRWLNSTVGSEPTLTVPFTPLRVVGRRIQVLGRELELAENGLPARITSFFSPANTRVERAGREILVRPAAFVVETPEGEGEWKHELESVTGTDLEASWSARSMGAGLRVETCGRLDYTGSGEVRMRLCADRDMDLRDARLEVACGEGIGRYFMGLDRQGGRLTADVHWKWDVRKRQDCFWMGDVNAGLMLRFKDAEYLRPPVNIYYGFRPLRLPTSWGNGELGGIDVVRDGEGWVRAKAYGGPRFMKRGEVLDFIFEVYVTPFRPLDTEKQWSVRFTHLGGPGREAIDEAVASADPRRGPNVVNVHHASYYSPYINYPYSDASFPAFCELVQRAHAKGVRLRVYYTTREITQNMPELFPLHAFNGEVILPGPGREARTLLHPHGPHGWLTENLRAGFVPAWEARVGKPYAELDLSVITTPDSRWNNFYLEGLRWLVEKSDFDGIYIDDTALDATSLRRARRILDERSGRLIDLHTWNHFNGWAGYANNLTIYMEILPYLDRLWLGEGFDASGVDPDFWLVEMSGLPFGVMGEMLDGTNPWRGMVFGETGRLPWSGDPRGLWAVWDEYGIQGTEFLPFFLEDPPVRTDHPDVLATVYRREGRSFVALGSWAETEVAVKLRVDWEALGLDGERARFYAPAISGMQPERAWRPDESIPVVPKQGWFLVLDEGERPWAAGGESGECGRWAAHR